MSSDLENTNPSLFKRLRYAKDMLIQMINPAQTNIARAATASASGASTATDFCKTSNGFASSASSSSATHHHPLKSATSTGFGGTGGAGVVGAGMKT